MTHTQKFADNLKTEMANNHISQEKLAEMLNTSQATDSRWTSGKHQPDFETLLAICEILEVTPNNLLGWDD